MDHGNNVLRVMTNPRNKVPTTTTTILTTNIKENTTTQDRPPQDKLKATYESKPNQNKKCVYSDCFYKSKKILKEGNNDNSSSTTKQKFNSETEEYIKRKSKQKGMSPIALERYLRNEAYKNGGYLEFPYTELEQLRRNDGVETGPNPESATPSSQACETTDQGNREEQEGEYQHLRKKLKADIQAQVHQHSHSWLEVCKWVVYNDYYKEHKNLALEILRTHCPEDLKFVQHERVLYALGNTILKNSFGQEQTLKNDSQIRRVINNLRAIGSSYADKFQAELDQLLEHGEVTTLN